VVNATRGRTLGDRVAVADRWWTRLRGLLGRPPLRPGEGLLITPCRGVHMFGMRYPLDVAFVDGAGGVVALYHALAPGRRTRMHRGAEHALELPAGVLRETETREGDTLAWGPAALLLLGALLLGAPAALGAQARCYDGAFANSHPRPASVEDFAVLFRQHGVAFYARGDSAGARILVENANPYDVELSYDVFVQGSDSTAAPVGFQRRCALVRAREFALDVDANTVFAIREGPATALRVRNLSLFRIEPVAARNTAPPPPATEAPRGGSVAPAPAPGGPRYGDPSYSGAPTSSDPGALRAHSHAYAGDLLLRAGKAAEAEAELRRAVGLDSLNGAYHARLGDALYAQGKWAEAEASYRAALWHDPANPHPRGMLERAREARERGTVTAGVRPAEVRAPSPSPAPAPAVRGAPPAEPEARFPVAGVVAVFRFLFAAVLSAAGALLVLPLAGTLFLMLLHGGQHLLRQVFRTEAAAR
jgi:uncharacterized membrane protein (UPF0127 family)/tetratricopeptide (TPR) repeat protein